MPDTDAPPEHALPEDAIARERGPLRRCIVSRAVRPKEELLRFVLGPGRQLIPDPGGRLPGRGLWLTPQADILRRAVKQGAFSKAARAPVAVPADLGPSILRSLRQRFTDLLGFARRGGQAVAGREKVLDWLREGRVALLVQAIDGSPAERERLESAARVPVLALLSGAELGAVFGRERAVHVAVAAGGLAEALRAEAGRIEGLRPLLDARG